MARDDQPGGQQRQGDRQQRSSALVHASYDVPIAGEALVFNPRTGQLEPEQDVPPLAGDAGEGEGGGADLNMHDVFGTDDAGDYAHDDMLPNFGAAFAWPVAVDADDGLSTQDWILQGYQAAVQAGGLRPLEVLESGAVILLAPAYNATAAERVMGAQAVCVGSQQVARANPFVLLTVQQLMCSDGTKFINTCQNPHCARSFEDHEHFHNLFSQPSVLHRTCNDVLGGRAPLCACAQAAITALWGSIGHDMALADEESFGSWFAAQEPGAMHPQ